MVLTICLTALGLLAGLPWSVPATGVGRRPRRRGRDPAVLPVPVLLELVASALDSGAGVPGALIAVGSVVGGDDGERLGRVAAALVLGSSWEAAWETGRSDGDDEGRRPRTGTVGGPDGRLALLAHALGPTWDSGQAPGPALRAAAQQHRVRAHRAAQEAAGRLGTALVLPLGLCLLPSFVLLGIVPVVLSLTRGFAGP